MTDQPETDLVNHPPHYNSHPSGVECIDIVRHHNFNVGNAIKYLWRAGLKDSSREILDLEKAKWYIQDEINRLAETETETETETKVDSRVDLDQDSQSDLDSDPDITSPMIEALAVYAHEAWTGWMRYQFEKSFIRSDGIMELGAGFVERWQRQAATNYDQLPESEKESDRVEARRMIEIFFRVIEKAANEEDEPS